MIELTDEILAKVIKKRKKASYKGTYGRLLVIGGKKIIVLYRQDFQKQ